MERLPVWKTSREAMALVAGSVPALIRTGGVVLAAVVLLDVASAMCSGIAFTAMLEHGPAILAELERVDAGALADPAAAVDRFAVLLAPMESWTGLANLAQLVAALGTAILCATWGRFLVTGRRPAGGWWRVPLGSAEIEMIGVLILLLLGHVLAFAVTVVVSVLAALAWPPAGYIVMFLVYVPAFLALLRLSLVVPHVACDGGIDLGAAWRLGRGQTWAIFGILGLTSLAGALLVVLAALPFAAVAWVHGALDGTMILIATVGWIVNMLASGVAMLLVLSGTAVIYARLTGGPATAMAASGPLV